MKNKPDINLVDVEDLFHWENYFSKYFNVVHNASRKRMNTLVFSDKSVKEVFRYYNKLFIPNREMCEIFADKIRTNDWLDKNNFLISPITEFISPFSSEKKLITKPRDSTGRVGFKVWETSQIVNAPNCIVQDFLEGTEFNLDILKDKYGTVYVCAKEKLMIKAGATFKCKLNNNPALLALGAKLGDLIDYVGSIDVDVIQTKNGELYIIDINPRLGGGFLHSVSLDSSFEENFLRIINGLWINTFICTANNYISQIEYNFIKRLNINEEDTSSSS